MRAALALALAVPLAGCVATVQPMPPQAELDRRLPPNRDGVLVSGELVRATWLPDMAGGAPDESFGRIGNDPQGILVASGEEAGTEGGKTGRIVFTFAGPEKKWRNGLAAAKKLWPDLARARARSAFHQPVKARFGDSDVWLVHDEVPSVTQSTAGEILLTLEAYRADPREEWAAGRIPKPEQVWVFGRRVPGGKETLRPEGPWMFWKGDAPAEFYYPGKTERAPDGRLLAFEAERWRPPVEKILSGATAGDFLPPLLRGYGLVIERIMNDALVEWKTRRLVDWARRAEASQLEDTIIAGEKGMLALDRKSRDLKDQVDAAARDGKSAPGASEAAQLLDQRRTLVGVVLGTMKQARAARSGGAAPAAPAQ